MIFDLSCPNGESVNDHIPVEYGSLRYESFQEALALVASIGRGAILLKKDLKAAFRHVPLSPYDYWLFFFRWKDDYYVELFLPFGLRTAPFLFNLFAEGLHWVFVYEYGWSLTHYLDDSLSVFPPNTDPKPLSTLYDSVCNDFGIQTEAKKDEMGTRVMHLGFNIDTTIMEASLPPNKRKRAIAIVHSLLLKSWISRTRLEETLGFLSHCCQVVPIGRAFFRNLFSLFQKATLAICSSHPPYAYLTHAARQDLQWWLIFLNLWSCSIPIQTIDARPTFHIATDASGKKGIGGVFGKEVFASRVPRGHRKKHINWKELYAVYYALLSWYESFSNGRLIILCDNTTAVSAINKRSSCQSLTTPLQALLLIAALFNIDLVAQWIPTDQNSVADALSRHDFKRLANLGYVTQASILHRPHPTIPTSTLRRKLLSSCGMESQSQLGKHILPVSKHTRRSSFATTPKHSRFRSSISQPGSPISPLQSRKGQYETTSRHCVTTMSNITSTPKSLITHMSTLPFVAVDESTATNQTVNASHLPPTSSSPLSTCSLSTQVLMPPTSKQHSVSPLLRSSDLANLPGKNGILKSLLALISPECTSLSSMTLPPSSSHRQRQTNFGKEQKSTSRASTLPYAPLPPLQSLRVLPGTSRLPTFHSISWFTFQQTLLRRSS